MMAQSPAPERSPGRLILVLPFDNRTDQPNLDWISEAIPEVLNRRLASAGFLPISRDDRLYALDHLGLPSTFQPSRASAIRLAQTLDADYIIDGTGLEADIEEHRLLADLLKHSGAGRNPVGRLDVERSFEVRGTRNGNGRMYSSGAATLGGYFPGVDTFLGLQLAAQDIVDDLVSLGFVRRLDPIRSTREWLRWARNKKI